MKRAQARRKNSATVATGGAVSLGGGSIGGSASTLDEDDYAAMEKKVRAEEKEAEILQAKEDQHLAELERKRVSHVSHRPSQRFSIREPVERMSISQDPHHHHHHHDDNVKKKTKKKEDVNLLYKNPNTGGGLDMATTTTIRPAQNPVEVKRSVQIFEGIVPESKMPAPAPPPEKSSGKKDKGHDKV